MSNSNQNLTQACFAHIFASSPHCPLSSDLSFSRAFLCRLASWLELGIQVGLTTDHYIQLPIQQGEGLSTKKVVAFAQLNKGLINLPDNRGLHHRTYQPSSLLWWKRENGGNIRSINYSSPPSIRMEKKDMMEKCESCFSLSAWFIHPQVPPLLTLKLV